MTGAVHRVERLALEVRFTRREDAYELRSRVEALGRSLIPSLLEDVFAAHAPDGFSLTLDRLELDLGTVRAARLEDDVLRALATALADALGRALQEARSASHASARLVPWGARRLAQFETYLLTGVAPVGRKDPFEPASRLRELAEQQPGALVAMLRRRGRDRYVLERLVLQVGEGGLRHLLSILAPGDAELILALLADTVLAFQEAPLAPLQYAAETALYQLFWILTLEFLLRDAEIQFNRRSFLAFLLAREAKRLHIPLFSLLRRLAIAVERVSRRTRRRSSLQGALLDLLQDFRARAARGAPMPEEEALGVWTEPWDRPPMLGGVASPVGSLNPGEATVDRESGRVEDRPAMEEVPPTGQWAEVFERWAQGVIPADAAAILATVDAALAEMVLTRPERRASWDLSGFAEAWALAQAARLDLDSFDQASFRRGLGATLAAHRGETGDGTASSGVRIAAIPSGVEEGLPANAGRLRGERADAAGGDVFGPAKRVRPSARAQRGSVDPSAEDAPGLTPDSKLPHRSAPFDSEHPRQAGAAWQQGGAAAPPLQGGARDPVESEAAPGLGENEAAPGLGENGAAPGPALDRYARLTRWLGETGDAALEQPPSAHQAPQTEGRASIAPRAGEVPSSLADALAVLPELDMAELVLLFLAEDVEETAGRLWRALRAMEPSQREALTARLTPWALEPGGAVARGLRALSPTRRMQALSRAGAAALHGDQIDLNALSRPLPALASSQEPSIAVRAAGDPTYSLNRARLFAWLDGAAAGPAEASQLGRYLAELSDAKDYALLAYLQARRARASARARWAGRLPEEGLGRLAHLLAPANAATVLKSVQVVCAAWRQIAPFGMRQPSQSLIWELLLDGLGRREPIDLAALLAALMQRLTGGDAAQLDRLQARSGQLAAAAGHAPLVAALRAPSGDQPRTPRAPPSSPRPPSDGRLHPAGPPAVETGQTLYVVNAGLVLFHPFLPTLFTRLGLLQGGEGSGLIAGVEAASRAVHLLQYLVDERLDRPEPELAFNKLLSGQALSQPIARSITPDPTDLALCDEMIGAVIGHWPPLRNSTPAALRETFLQREGRLRRGEGKWLLQVQRKTLDVLIDQLPWGFSVVYHPWMQAPIHVTW